MSAFISRMTKARSVTWGRFQSFQHNNLCHGSIACFWSTVSSVYWNLEPKSYKMSPIIIHQIFLSDCVHNIISLNTSADRNFNFLPWPIQASLMLNNWSHLTRYTCSFDWIMEKIAVDTRLSLVRPVKVASCGRCGMKRLQFPLSRIVIGHHLHVTLTVKLTRSLVLNSSTRI